MISAKDFYSVQSKVISGFIKKKNKAFCGEQIHMSTNTLKFCVP